jgi:histidinol-phosphatase
VARITSSCPQEFVDLAHRLADRAGEVIKPYYREKLDIIDKSDASPVTIADRNAEAAMREIIEKEFPDHGIYGEEHGQVRVDSEFVWVLDPIDGTHSFISGCPTFTTLIGLTRNGQPVSGIMDQVISGERWAAANGESLLNGQKLQTRSCSSVHAASLFSWGAELFDSERPVQYRNIYDAAKLKRFGYDSYAYGLLAHGFSDLIVDFDMKPYDYCALVPIVEFAGGTISDWDGQPLSLTNGGNVLATGSTDLHEQVLEILK